MKSILLSLLAILAIVVAFRVGYEYRNYELAVQRANIQHTENMI